MDSNANQEEQLRPRDSAPLPPELAWEQMEAGILRKMEAAQKPDGPSGPSNNRGTILFGILLLLLLIPMYCTLTGETSAGEESVVARSPEPSVSPDSSGTQQATTLSSEPNLSPDRTAKPSAATAPGSDTGGARQPEQERRQPPLLPSEQTKSSAETSSLPGGVYSSSGTDRIAPRKHHQRTTEVAATPLPPPRNEPALTANRPGQIESGKDSILFRTVALLPPKRLVVSPARSTPEIPIHRRPTFAIDHESTPTAPTPRRFSLLLGVADWRMGYERERPERAAYESTLRSWRGGITYLHPLSNRYTIVTGLEWRRLESRLDWSAPVEDYQVTLRDTILRVETNSLTGKESKLRGDVTVNVPANRVVRHHNQAQLLQIPLAVGKTWRSRNWQADLLVGGALTVYTQHRGRTLYRGELQDYAGSSTDFINNQWQFSTLFAGRLTYRINKHLGITAGVQWQRSLSNWSTETNISMHPRVISGSLGITYSR